MTANQNHKTGEHDQDSAKDALIEAAISVFAAYGFNGASTRRIADEGDVNLDLIAYYFKNKFNLWKAAVDRLFKESEAIIVPDREAFIALDDRAKLKQLVRQYVFFMAKRPEYAAIVINESRMQSPRLDWMIKHYLKDRSDFLSDLISRMQAKNILPPGAPTLFKYIIDGAVQSLFSQSHLIARKHDIDPLGDKKIINEYADLVERILLGEGHEAPPT